VDIDLKFKSGIEVSHAIETDNYEGSSSLSVFNAIKEIYINCEESSKSISNISGSHDNMQYSPTLAIRILNFCKLISCWSAVMVPIFGYGNVTESSAKSESLFKDLKSVIFKNKSLPLRLDDIFITHVNSILGLMNLIASDNHERTNEIADNDEKISESKVPETLNEKVPPALL